MASPRNFSSGQFEAGVTQTMRVGLQQVLTDAVNKLASRTSTGLAEVLRAVAEPPSRARQRAMYHRLGVGTQRAVIEKYDSEIGSNGHAVYRAGSNRLSGRLRPLLVGNVDGTIFRVVNGPAKSGGVRIELFNPKAMNSRARHWARLNMGAGQNAQGQRSPVFKVRFRGRNVDLSFNASPRPRFEIPGGFWFEGGENVPPGLPVQGSAFYLRPPTAASFARSERKFTRGIAPRFFLDAGLGYFAREMPLEFNRMIRDELGSKTRLKFSYDVVGSSRIFAA